jgi:hypothetical protein
MTLAFTGLCLLNVIFSMASQKPYDAINQAAEEPDPTFAIFGLVFLLITVGGCIIAPNAIAHQSLNGKKQCCIMPWFGCFLLIAIVVSFPIVGSIVRAGQPYKSYCAVGTDICTDQFKFQDTCNHTTENPMGRPGATAYVKVSKKYCDSKGMDYPGAWYEQIVSHIMTALLFVLSNAVTFYICWYKKGATADDGCDGSNRQHDSTGGLGSSHHCQRLKEQPQTYKRFPRPRGGTRQCHRNSVVKQNEYLNR